MMWRHLLAQDPGAGRMIHRSHTHSLCLTSTHDHTTHCNIHAHSSPRAALHGHCKSDSALCAIGMRRKERRKKGRKEGREHTGITTIWLGCTRNMPISDWMLSTPCCGTVVCWYEQGRHVHACMRVQTYEQLAIGVVEASVQDKSLARPKHPF